MILPKLGEYLTGICMAKTAARKKYTQQQYGQIQGPDSVFSLVLIFVLFHIPPHLSKNLKEKLQYMQLLFSCVLLLFVFRHKPRKGTYPL